MQELVSLSYLDDGPRLAKEFLEKNGIHLILLRHLAKTHLDGAAMFLSSGAPVIGLTLRYDRLDNFWFCLCHELGHIAKHSGVTPSDYFVDDLQTKSGKSNRFEKEADSFAENALIPSKQWTNASIRLQAKPGPELVREFANKFRISPAIVAGRIRLERSNFKILSQLVGHGSVRKHFDLN